MTTVTQSAHRGNTMFFTLDRTEEDFAVLIDENGKKTDVPISTLPVLKAGSVYEIKNDIYIYNEKETQKRKAAAAERLKKIFG